MSFHQVQQQFEVVGSRESDIEMDKVGFEKLFGRLLAMVADEVSIVLVHLESIAGETQIPLGLN